MIAKLLNKTRGFLGFIQTFADFIDAICQAVISQQVKTRQNAVQRRNALFRLLKLNTLLLVIIFMITQRPLQFDATAVQLTDFGFRIRLKRYRQMATNKAAERLMQTLGFLYIEGERGEAFGKHFTFRMEAFNTAFTRSTTKQRHFRET